MGLAGFEPTTTWFQATDASHATPQPQGIPIGGFEPTVPRSRAGCTCPLCYTGTSTVAGCRPRICRSTACRAD